MTRREQDALEKAFAIEEALDTVLSVELLAPDCRDRAR